MNAKRKTPRTKINILLAIRGRADNARLIKTLATLKQFKIHIDNPRTISATLESLESHKDSHLLICDELLITEELTHTLAALQENNQALPLVLIRHSNKPPEQFKLDELDPLHSLMLDTLNDAGLASFLLMSFQYGLMNRQYNSYRHEANVSDVMGLSYSYRAAIMPDGKFVNEWLSESFQEVTGFSREEIGNIGGWISRIHEDDLPKIKQFTEDICENKSASVQYRITNKEGKTLWMESHGQPQWSDDENRVTSIIGGCTDITSRKTIENQLSKKEQQEAAVASLSVFANSDPSLKELFEKAVELVNQTLKATLCEVLAVYGSSSDMMLRAGTYQDVPLYEKIILSTEKNNELHYTKERGEIVTIENIKKETRFKPSSHLRKHKVISGLCAPIMAGNNMLGIIGIYNDSAYTYSSDEINFILGITSILGNIAAQESTEMRLKTTRLVLEKQQDYTVDTNGFVLESLQDTPDDNINAIVQSALELHARDNIISATAEASTTLFISDTWQEGMPAILEKLGKAVNASRAYLFEVNPDLSDSPSCRQQFEWLNQDIKPRQYRTKDAHLSFDAIGLESFSQFLKEGKYVAANLQDIDESEQAFYKKQKIKSILLMPIFVESAWWGFLGFDVCKNQREWTNAEIDALKISANTLSTAIERGDADFAFRSIIEGTASKTGRGFFKYLVQHLAQVFHARYCVISEQQQDGRFRMHALWEKDHHGIPFDYASLGATEFPTSSNDVIYYPNDAQNHLPKDKWLKGKNIHAYLGASIQGIHGETLGQIIVMDPHRINARERNLDILKVFSVRAGMEMQRLQDEHNIQLLASISVDSPHLIMTSDKQGNITFKNPATDQISEKLSLRSETDLLPDDHIQLLQEAVISNHEIIKEKSIGDFTLQWHYHYQSDIERINLFAIDITQRHKLEERLRKDAFHDTLTGLPNRSFFNNLLSHALERNQRRGDYNFAVLFLDLDRFKYINDSLGHAYGDRLLQKAAQILSACIRPGDYVARFGGDEFVILLDSINHIKEATSIANRIQKSLSHSINLDQHECFTSASIGIASSEREYKNTEEILRDADIAMYSAKQKGKAQYVIFDKPMHDEIVHVLQLETDLRNAIKNNELLVYYQPIYSFSQHSVTSFEALVRWQHPEKGLLEPDAFIPVAEDMGIIREIDHWVLQTASHQLKEWRKKFSNHHDLKMGVNLSASHFNHMDLLSQIGHLLEDLNLPADSLQLELTESIIMQSNTFSSEMLAALEKRGLKIRIDDFGVGYSSFSRLLNLPIDSLKIDRSFINSMVTDAGSLNITRAIIDLAHDLGMQVIAEGVETAGQFQILGRMGCHHVQGFYIAKPLPVDEASKMLMDDPSLQFA